MRGPAIVAEDQDVPDGKSHGRNKVHARQVGDNGKRVGHGHEVGDNHSHVDGYYYGGAGKGRSPSIMSAQQVHQALTGFKTNSFRNFENREQKGNAQQHRPEQGIMEHGPSDSRGEHQRRVNVQCASHNRR